jgi:hypothetical protein
MQRNFLVVAALAFGGVALGPGARPVPACPMCAQANETEDKRPQAYQASILFMMSMPALIAAGFGFGLYRLSRRAAADGAWDENGPDSPDIWKAADSDADFPDSPGGTSV